MFGACSGGESRLTEGGVCYIMNASILGHFADRSGLLAMALFLTADIFDDRNGRRENLKRRSMTVEDNCIAIMLMPRAVCKGHRYAAARIAPCG